MSSITIICFLVCLGIVVSCFRKNADVLSPARVFGFIWSLVIGLADLKLSRLQHQWAFEDWIQILIGPLSFLVGIFITYVLNLQSQPLGIETMRQKWQTQLINHKKLFNIIIILFVLFLVAYTSIYFTQGEIPLFSSRPGIARLNFEMFGLGLFLHNVALIGFFTVLFFLIVLNER